PLVSSLRSAAVQDGVVELARALDLDAGEAGGGEEAGVLGGAALPALRLHQHVEGVELRRQRPPAVLMQQGLHQQHPATCAPTAEWRSHTHTDTHTSTH